MPYLGSTRISGALLQVGIGWQRSPSECLNALLDPATESRRIVNTPLRRHPSCTIRGSDDL
jgi:hypothetical protein